MSLQKPELTLGRPQLRPSVLALKTALRDMILAGDYLVGAKLPSEAELIDRFNASRHMVREAISELRAEGLIVSRQGAGVFVAAPAAMTAEPVPPETQSMTEIFELFEFRVAAETEAAALAAIRRSPAQEEEIFLRHAQFGDCLRAGQPIAEADAALHLAISLGANNRQFSDFVATYSPILMQLSSSQPVENEYKTKLQLHEEHDRIVQAIRRADGDGARQSMRDHLMGSQLRYRKQQQRRS